MRSFFVLCISFLFCSTLIYSQITAKGTIGGYIYDISNREALIGANVYIKDLKMGKSTNTSGYFVISDIPIGEYILTCSMVGYKLKSLMVKVNNEKNIILKIYLESDAIKEKEVVVTAEPIKVIDRLFEKPISKIELTHAQISKIPQVVESDLLRSLQTLPGIVSISDFSSALYIRGGKPDQNLYLLDGADVYNPEHAFGLFSSFNTDAIKQVDLSKGGFGSEYGGRLSSVLDIINIDGNRNTLQGDLSISLLSAKTTLQTPIGDIGSISGSFRRTYFDQTVAKWIKNQNIPNYYFFDGNLKAFFDIKDDNKLTLSYFGGQDNLSYIFDPTNSASPAFRYDWGNNIGSINWKTIFSAKLFANFWLTTSNFASNFNYNDLSINEDNNIADLTLKGNIDYYFSDKVNLRFGFEQKNLHTLLKEDFPEGLIYLDKKSTYAASFFSLNWKPSILWDIETGLRYEYFSSDKNFHNLDPRFSIKYRLSEDMNLKLATGIYHQYLDRVERGFVAAIWSTADKYVNGSSSYHYILGFQKEFVNVYQLEFEAFYKKYNNIYTFNQLLLTDLTANSYDATGRPIYTDLKELFDRGDGYSVGLEILLKKDVGSITGWLGYSLTNTQYTLDGINQNKPFVPRHNRGSVINFVANMDWKDFMDELSGESKQEYKSKWFVGMNFVFSTGQPITVPSSVYSSNTLPNSMSDGPYIYPTDIDNFTLPPYIRMDISITYEKKYEGWSLSPYLQIFNAGNRKNVFFITYDHRTSNNLVTQQVNTFSMIPILPSIGVNIKF